MSKHPTAKVLELPPRPNGPSVRHICTAMGKSEAAAASAVDANTESPRETVNREGISHISDIPVASTVVVASSPRDGSGTANSVLDLQVPVVISCLDALRAFWQGDGMAAQSVNRLIAAKSMKMCTSYDCNWTYWASWCGQQDFNPCTYASLKVVEFISQKLHTLSVYLQICTAASSVWSILHKDKLMLTEHCEIHLLLEQLLHEQALDCLMTAEVPVWPIGLVLQELAQWGPNKDLTFDTLSNKTVMLLVLTTMW
ncbi:hypothetical protein IW150_000870 [Coemansia sp. RSA 2607]|nr:hypothetical protein IW150_000870 [Coemansia sp. RSA 2607]KAJ2398242.1 hypothetical protein GGI05_000208 [Coemansia sp. RSA 2603]